GPARRVARVAHGTPARGALPPRPVVRLLAPARRALGGPRHPPVGRVVPQRTGVLGDHRARVLSAVRASIHPNTSTPGRMRRWNPRAIVRRPGRSPWSLT